MVRQAGRQAAMTAFNMARKTGKHYYINFGNTGRQAGREGGRGGGR